MRNPPFKAKQLLRWAGILVWAMVGARLLLNPSRLPVYLVQNRYIFWLGAFLIFGVAFWLTSFSEAAVRPRWQQLLSLAIQTTAALAMIALVCTGYEGALLVIVAAQLGWLLSLPIALIWAAGQALLMGMIIASSWPAHVTLSLLMAYLGFQILVLFASYLAASEARARRDLARANAELRATQELLTNSSRMAERERISRELHDVLGHHLTALSLNLEVATHLSQGKVLEHVNRAQSLTKRLLGDVREVVSALRGEEAIDLELALRTLVEDIPGPRVHLNVPEDLKINDPLRAQALLRCVQEIVTNTVRHAEARNLWIELVKTPDGLEVRARDDGQGAKRVRPGHGLTGMRERLEEVGGRLEIESQPHQGFKVNAWVPLPGGAP